MSGRRGRALLRGMDAVTRENFWEARGRDCFFTGGDRWFSAEERGSAHRCTLRGICGGTGFVCEAGGRTLIIPFGRLFFKPASDNGTDNQP